MVFRFLRFFTSHFDYILVRKIISTSYQVYSIFEDIFASLGRESESK